MKTAKVAITRTVRGKIGNEEERLTIFITEKAFDGLINAMYPANDRDSKGYIELVNFLYKE